MKDIFHMSLHFWKLRKIFKMDDELIKKSAHSVGAIFSVDSTESCTLVGKKWVLGVCHGEKNISDIISVNLSFDLLEDWIIPPERNNFSLDPFFVNPGSTIKNWQIAEDYGVGFFAVNENIDGYTPSSVGVNIPAVSYDFSIDDEIFAVGYPRGLWTRKVIVGRIVSESGRFKKFNDEIHACAELGGVTGGFSGGAVFSKHGELIGVVTNMNKNYAQFTKIGAIYKIFSNPGMDFPMSEVENYKEFT